MATTSSAPVPRERFHGCLLGQAVGDAVGAPFEGMPADYVYWALGPVHELIHRPGREPLRYTDDTQMLIGVAEALVADGLVRPEHLLVRFVANYEPERGYGPGARRILEMAAEGGDWQHLAETVFPGGSFGNGAAMRVAPVGLVFAHDLDRVVEQARLSALPTHRHPLGIEGAELLALAVALAAAGPPLDRAAFYRTLRRHCRSEEFRWQARAAGKLRRRHAVGFLGNSLPAHRSVMTAIACFTTCPDSFEHAVAKAIALGDDTDTLAAMTGALVGAHLGVGAIPGVWLERLENGPKGPTTCAAWPTNCTRGTAGWWRGEVTRRARSQFATLRGEVGELARQRHRAATQRQPMSPVLSSPLRHGSGTAGITSSNSWTPSTRPGDVHPLPRERTDLRVGHARRAVTGHLHKDQYIRGQTLGPLRGKEVGRLDAEAIDSGPRRARCRAEARDALSAVPASSVTGHLDSRRTEGASARSSYRSVEPRYAGTGARSLNLFSIAGAVWYPRGRVALVEKSSLCRT
jgi:poly(ADP-ribose) glycohydrolase ARH3